MDKNSGFRLVVPFLLALGTMAQVPAIAQELAPADITRNNLLQEVASYTEALQVDKDNNNAQFRRGVAYMKLGKNQEAIADFSQVINKVPTNFKAFQNRGLCYARQGDNKLAISDFSSAMRLDPASARHVYARGCSWMASGDYKQALDDFRSALTLNPKLLAAYINATACCRFLERYEDGVKFSTEALAIKPEAQKALINRGGCFHSLKRYQDAIADYSKAIALQPAIAATYYARGTAYYALNDWDNALADFSKAIELNTSANPRNFASPAKSVLVSNISADSSLGSAYYGRALTEFRLGKYDAALLDARQAVEQGQALAYVLCGECHERSGQYTEALDDYTQSIKADPSGNYGEGPYGGSLDDRDSTTYSNRALIYLRLGEPDKAIKDCSKSIELCPQRADAYIIRSVAYREQKQEQESRADLEKSISLTLHEPTSYFNRAVASLNWGNYKQVLADCNTLLQNAPEMKEAYAVRAQAYMALKQPAKAAADLLRAGKNSTDHIQWSELYAVQGNYKKVVQVCSEAINKNPQQPDSYLLRSAAFRHLSMWKEALADIDKAISLAPTNADAYAERALSYLELDKFDDAADDCTEAIKLRPGDRRPYFIRAVAYMALGQYQDVVDDATKYIGKDEGDAESYFLRAQAYALLGKQPESERDLAKAKSLNMDGKRKLELPQIISPPQPRQDGQVPESA